MEPCAPKLDQAFFSFYALLLYHIINLFQISVSCFPCLCQSLSAVTCPAHDPRSGFIFSSVQITFFLCLLFWPRSRGQQHHLCALTCCFHQRALSFPFQLIHQDEIQHWRSLTPYPFPSLKAPFPWLCFIQLMKIQFPQMFFVSYLHILIGSNWASDEPHWL